VNSIETNRFERDQLEARQADRELRQQDYQYSPRNLKGGLWRRDDDGSWTKVVEEMSCDENPTCPGEFVAVVEAVRTGDGFILGRGIASCGPDERDWTKRSRQARRSMAQTRAAGKAMRLLFSWIMEMAGYAATPFEEMEGCQVNEQPNPQPHPQAPTEQPRAKREPKPQPISREQCAELLAAWKAIPGNQSEPSGDVAKWHARFFDFARKVSGRDDFDPSRAANWTVSDYEAVDRALTALGDK
jgi:ribosomal protein L19E